MDHENWEYLNHEWTRMDTNGHEVWEYLNHETHETHENMIGWENHPCLDTDEPSAKRLKAWRCRSSSNLLDFSTNFELCH